jgi:flagellar biosynthesis chaperone FliJ
MKLETERQVKATRRKLALLEKHYEEFQNKPMANEYVKDISLRSLKQFINQLKEEIAWYECHARSRTEVAEAGQQ